MGSVCDLLRREEKLLDNGTMCSGALMDRHRRNIIVFISLNDQKTQINTLTNDLLLVQESRSPVDL